MVKIKKLSDELNRYLSRIYTLPKHAARFAAALFYRTHDPHRTQDSGRRTTGPGPDLKHTAISGRDSFSCLLSPLLNDLDLKSSPSPRAPA